MKENIQIVHIHVCHGPMKNYSYVIFDQDTSDAIVIDPAWEIQKYLDVFEKYRLIPKEILITHAHFDHINLVEDLADRYEVRVWISHIERSRLPFNNAKYIQSFSHGKILEFGNLKCIAYITPGHTQGSSCFLFGSHLFTGDTLFIEGCGICFSEEGNADDLYSSVMFLKRAFSSDTKIYPGHRYFSMPGQPLSSVMNQNIYLHLEDREKFIQFRLRPNQQNLFNFR